MLVEKIMTKKVISVSADTMIPHIAHLLSEYKIHGLPVIDDNGKVIGIITESDFFIKKLPDLDLPSSIHFLGKTKNKPHRSSTNTPYAAPTSSMAKDIMTKNPITVPKTMKVIDLVNLLKEKKLFTVPVVNEENKLVGIVTVADIISLINNE